MTKKNEKLLFKTIEDAIDFGINRGYGEFIFSELYDMIDKLEKKAKKKKENK